MSEIERNKQAMKSQLDPAQQSTLDYMGVGSDASRGMQPVRDLQGKRPEKPDQFPALKKETVLGQSKPVFEVDYSDEIFTVDEDVPIIGGTGLGVSVPVKAKPIVTYPGLVSPDISVAKVMDFTRPRVKQSFLDAEGVFSGDPNNPEDPLRFMGFKLSQGEDADKRFTKLVQNADKFGATYIVPKGVEPVIENIDQFIKIPYDKGIVDMTIMPDIAVMIKKKALGEITDDEVAGLAGTLYLGPVEYERKLLSEFNEQEMEDFVDQKMITSLNFMDRRKAAPIYAHVLNKRMIRAGVTSSRTRLAMLTEGISSPNFGDMNKIGQAGLDATVRFPIQATGWFIGESLDILDEVPILFGLTEEDKPGGEFDLRNSVDRQEALNRVWTPAAWQFVARMKQKGVDVPIHAAEEYMHTLTGMLPRGVKLAAEVMGPGKLLVARGAIKNAKELRLFDDFVSAHVRDGYTGDAATLLNRFVNQRPHLKKDKLGNVIVTNPADLPPDSLFQRLRFSGTRRRVLEGLEQKSAAMPVASRKEIIDNDDYIARLEKRKTLVTSRVNKAGISTEQDKLMLASIQKELKLANANKLILEQRSAKAPWMRDAQRMDTFMILGATYAGHYTQMNYDDDDGTPTEGLLGNSAIGELLGIGGGIAADLLLRGGNPAFFALMRSPMGAAVFTKMRGKQAYMEFLAKHVGQYSPGLQAGVAARGEVLNEAFDAVIAEGLDESLVARGYASVSGLIGLQALEDATRMQIATGEMAGSPQVVEALQANLTRKTHLLAALREVLYTMDAPQPGATKTAADEFYEVMNTAYNAALKDRDGLSETLDIINNNGLQHFTDNISSSLGVYRTGRTGGKTTTSIEAALEDLHHQNLIDRNNMPTEDFEQLSDTITQQVTKTVTTVAQKTEATLGNLSSAQRKVKDFRDMPKGRKFSEGHPGGIIAQGAKTPVLLGEATEGDLLAAVLEAVHTEQKILIQGEYQRLGTSTRPVQFYELGGNNQPIAEGAATVNVGDVFDALFSVKTEEGIISLERASKRGIKSRGAVNLTNQAFKDIAAPFFEAQAKNGETKDDVINALGAALGVQKRKSRDYEIDVIDALRKAAQDPRDLDGMFDISLYQLREMDRAITTMRYDSTGTAAEILPNVQSLIKSKFNSFEVIGDDGARIQVGALGVKSADGTVVPAQQILESANSQWSSFKNRWYDKRADSPIHTWMSWGNRQVGESTVNNPLGITHGNLPTSKWLDIEEISKMNIDTAVKYASSIAEALGQKVYNREKNLDEYVFLEGDHVTEAFKAILRAKMARHIVSQGGSLVPGQAMDEMARFMDIFQVRSADGTMKPMMDSNEVFNNAQGLSRTSVGDEVFETEIARAASDMNTALVDMLKPAQDQLKYKTLTVDILNSFTGRNLKQEGIAEALTGSGMGQIQEIKSRIKEATKGELTDDQIDGVLANVYLDSMLQKVFQDTNTTVVSGTGGTMDTLIPVFSTSSQQMNDMIGVGNPTKAAVVKSLIGEKRYKVWEAAATVVSDMDSKKYNGARLLVNGIPRGLSFESWTARTFAWQRGAIGLKWFATEAGIQQVRLKNFNMLQGALLDPEMGELFLEMVRTGKPLSPERDALFRRAMYRAAALQANNAQLVIGEKTISDKYGMEYKINPGPLGTPQVVKKKTGEVIESFPSLEKRKQMFNTPSDEAMTIDQDTGLPRIKIDPLD